MSIKARLTTEDFPLPLDSDLSILHIGDGGYFAQTLQICGCGQPCRIEGLVADMLARIDQGGDLTEAAAAEAASTPFVTADLVLHWLYEIDLLDHHLCLDTAALTPEARRIGLRGDIERLHDRDICASAPQILSLLSLLARAPKGASLHSFLATAIPAKARAAGSILLTYLWERDLVNFDNHGRSAITAAGRALLARRHRIC